MTIDKTNWTISQGQAQLFSYIILPPFLYIRCITFDMVNKAHDYGHVRTKLPLANVWFVASKSISPRKYEIHAFLLLLQGEIQTIEKDIFHFMEG